MPTPNVPVAATPRCDEPPVPALGQCLFCYLEDVVATHGCAGHQHSERWGDAQPVPMPGLTAWLKAHGGFCDCEVLMNVWGRGQRDARYEPMFCPAAEDLLASGAW